MEFVIDAASRTPIYRQLARQIREAIAKGKLCAEERLPSVRELSRSLVVNPNTIARVYTELEREGVLTTRQGLGVYVAPPKDELTRKVRTARLTELADQFLTDAVHLGFSSEDVLCVVSQRAREISLETGVMLEFVSLCPMPS